MRHLVIAVVLLAFVPAIASADWIAAPTPASVASAHWPDSACHGREFVHLVPQADVDAYKSEDPPGTHTGYSPMHGSCDVYIADWMLRDPIIYCSLLVHEFGHTAGLEHSPDPTNVMYGPVIVIAPECVQFAKTAKQRVAPHRRVRKALRRSAG
jgi:hypothetical protein